MLEESELPRLLERAHKRWLRAVVIEQGGRLAAPLAAGCAVLGLLLGWRLGIAWAMAAACLGGAAVLAVLATVYRRRRRHTGLEAPEWVLLLERQAEIPGTLAALTEQASPFTPLLRREAVRRLSSDAPKKAIRRPDATRLAVALCLLLLPLLPELLPARTDSHDAPNTEDALARASRTADPPEGEAQPQPSPSEASGAGGGPNGDAGEPNNPGGGQRNPQPSNPSGGGESPPDNVNPERSSQSPPPDGETGERGPDDTPPPPPETKIDETDMSVRPEAGEGEKRTEYRKRWIYDDTGDRAESGAGSGTDWRRRAEESVPRMKLTPGERELLDRWFRKLGP